MIKKQSVGIWINVAVVLLILISLIVYKINISGDGYFKNASVGNLAVYSVAAIVMLAAAILLAQKNADGMAAAALEIISGVLRIAAAVLLMLCLVNLISARAEGLGFIYFSNAEVLQEVQTPENMSSAAGTIANMVCMGISSIAAMIAAFFGLQKKEK